MEELKQQSNDMLSNYAQLKQENQQLFQAKKKLAGTLNKIFTSISF